MNYSMEKMTMIMTMVAVVGWTYMGISKQGARTGVPVVKCAYVCARVCVWI